MSIDVIKKLESYIMLRMTFKDGRTEDEELPYVISQLGKYDLEFFNTKIYLNILEKNSQFLKKSSNVLYRL